LASHRGLLLRERAVWLSMSFRRLSSQAIGFLMSLRVLAEAIGNRFLSAVSIPRSCRCRVTKAVSACISSSLTGRTAGRITEPRVGDVVEFKLRVVNSYDATNAFRVMMAGRRLLCLNGLIGSERTASVYARHTAGFSAERAIDGIRRAFERYLTLDTEWKRWAVRPVTDSEAQAVFEAMPDSNPKRLERLGEYWDIEARSAGPTVWGIYNTLTHWSTHAPIRQASQANRAAIVLDRESLVQRTLETAVFQRLAASNEL